MFKFYGLLFLLVLGGCSKKSDHSLTIATAANVQFAMEAMVKAFKAESGIQADIVLGSSGRLNTQIKSGAPYDVFVSADLKYTEDLYEKNLAQDKPIVYGYGVLVLWQNSLGHTVKLEDLKSDSVTKIAVANPETAPYGTAALQVLNKTGLINDLNDKLVFGESISQVNQYVLSKAAQVGFTAKSVVISRELGHVGSWIEIDPNLYDPITQGAVAIHGENEKAAKRFLQFMTSNKGKSILRSFGYRVD